jgi:hypothetical protein
MWLFNRSPGGAVGAVKFTSPMNNSSVAVLLPVFWICSVALSNSARDGVPGEFDVAETTVTWKLPRVALSAMVLPDEPVTNWLMVAPPSSEYSIHSDGNVQVPA